MSKKVNSWKRLEIWDDEVLGSLSVLELAKGLPQWYEKHGCYCGAIVVSNSLQIHIIEDVIKGKEKIFHDTASAVKWIKKQKKEK